MKKYLYLTKKEWVKTWNDGGTIPIPLASHFLSDSRKGTHTPDENLIHNSDVDLKSLEPHIRIGAALNVTIRGGTADGVSVPEISDASFYQEDGLILCLSNQCSREIAERLERRHASRLLMLQN